MPTCLCLAGLIGAGALICVLVLLRPGLPWSLHLSALIAPYVAFLAVWLLVAGLFRRHVPHDRFGPANTVTLVRAALVCGLLGPLIWGAAAGWGVALTGAVALMLDGVDGWLARRTHLVSDFGARFDMEVDAALGLVLALHAYRGTAAGIEVLALGMVRYVFVAAAAVWPWLLDPLPESRRRKVICVLQLAILVLLQVPGLSGDAAILLARAALAAVLWSFFADIMWLRARRG
ncbi:CDP-alcohol phosphatidyltransferase family protein [Paracoccus pacificus]|uniref:CDP-alcohol phosphatidyltransferase family protein n=1 Tax=Paracoccus pacificus TaxID=1463598 RepID=A0ABW4R4Y3_9RHOB